MKRIILLHGSWHGAWCWFKVAPLLRSNAEVVVPNLPGRGRDPALLQTVTLGRMVRHVARSLPADQRTTIVVHSRYGIIASALAEQLPDRIRRVIYLASYMLPNTHRALSHFAGDRDAFIGPHVKSSRLGACDWLEPVAYREGLYADCCEEDVELATTLLCREPSLPVLSRLHLTPERYGSVRRAYIRLTKDRAVSPALQDRLIDASPPERVESLAASHSAYFSCPERLVEVIESLDRD